MNTIALIQTFCKVVQCRSFTGAAKQLAISPAAVSKQVSLLESELGVSLLERTTRKVLLTSVGQVYYQEVQTVLQALEQANSVVSASQTEPHGLLRVKSSRYFAETIILPRLPAFSARYPQINLDLQIAEQVPHLLDEGLDVVFGMSISVASNSIQKKITTTRYVFCASPEYLERFGTPEKPSDLQDHHYLTHSMRNPNDQWIFPSGETVYLNPRLYLNDAEALCDSACRGLGITALHHYQAAEALKTGKLVEVLSKYRMPIIPVYLFYHPARFIQPKLRVWIEIMTADLDSFM
ncbi:MULTISPECIES: LysR family transcriptional regulator [Legionella]|uniref:Transcriptional regulator n=1 Tax=Legionella drozanskii LLAP-1 TaxID=1212489 RepID=A0A0W0SWD5_9GAMM|nr:MULTISPECIES: LysR family transcriptional regulator [Legionella]KTC87604.1 transcriptional regulator [Legionella drozanskii LLAP-1]PJE16577.1 MAG: LysR family transcriptional regulator [Legionella sp.]